MNYQQLKIDMGNLLRPGLALAVFLLLCAYPYALSQSGSTARYPNIVLILADDMGYGDLRSYNPQSMIFTPNMDRLAAEGMRFTDAHSPSSVCTPTRYGLLTGRYAWRGDLKRGVLDGYSPPLIEPERLTIPLLLKGYGYTSAVIGKWHLGLGRGQKTDYSKPLKPSPKSLNFTFQFGFDYFFGIPASLDMPPYTFIENGNVLETPTAQIAASEMRRKGGEGYWRAGAIAPGFKHEDVLPRITEKAISFIQKQSAKKPFFLYFPLTAPHTPWMPTAEFRGKSGAGYYGDFVAQVDATVGRVMRALSEAKLADNTLIILTSDNGAHWLPEDIAKWGHRANADWRGQKADIWEGGHRVPFIARWPGRIKPGTISDEMICLTDVMATISAIVGARIPDYAGEDSFNLLPVLLGRKLLKPVREAIVHHSVDGTFAIRHGDRKLVMALGSRGFSEPKDIQPQTEEAQGQLYNLRIDSEEKNNLWLQEPEIVERLTALLKKYQSEGRSRPLDIISSTIRDQFGPKLKVFNDNSRYYLRGDFNGDGLGDIAVEVNVEEGREELKGHEVKYIDINPYEVTNGIESDPVSNMGQNCLGIAIIHGTAAGWHAPSAKYIFYECFSDFRMIRKGQKIYRGSGSRGPTPVPKGDSIQLDLETGGTMLIYWNGKTYRGFGQRGGD
jgi:arylsulfatase A-like enzyme